MLETFGCQHTVEAAFTTTSLESSDAFLPAANRTQHKSTRLSITSGSSDGERWDARARSTKINCLPPLSPSV